MISESCSYKLSCFILLHTAEEKREYMGLFSPAFAKVSIFKRYYPRNMGVFQQCLLNDTTESQQS